jgi:hypothetical protein
MNPDQGQKMDIRMKVAKGDKYHQVVETRRVGDKVSQRVVVILGTTADPVKALAELKQELHSQRVKRSPFPEKNATESIVLAKERKRLDVSIARLAPRVEILAALIKSGALK